MTSTARAVPHASAPAVPPRQVVARVLVAIGLVAITVWWFSWVSLRSILSESRSDAVGRALVHDDTVRAEVEDQVREGMYISGALSLGFTEADLAAAASAVAVDPTVEDLIAERVADAHRSALRPEDPFDFLSPSDDQPFVDASIRALEAERGDITIPDLQWLFTTTVDGGFPGLAGTADQADTWRTPALLLAVVGFVGSAIVHPDRRPRRWLARWCLTAGVLTLVVPFLLPPLASVLGGHTASVLRAVAASLRGGAPLRGAILLVLIGALLSLGTWAKQARTDGHARRSLGPARMPTGPILLGTRATAPPPATPTPVARPDRETAAATASAIREAAGRGGR